MTNIHRRRTNVRKVHLWIGLLCVGVSTLSFAQNTFTPVSFKHANGAIASKGYINKEGKTRWTVDQLLPHRGKKLGRRTKRRTARGYLEIL